MAEPDDKPKCGGERHRGFVLWRYITGTVLLAVSVVFSGRGKGRPLTRTPLPQASAYLMIRRRAAAAGIATRLGNHSFRATGITAYLKNGGTLEKAAQMANHASTRTTQLYDRRHEELSLDEVEKICV